MQRGFEVHILDISKNEVFVIDLSPENLKMKLNLAYLSFAGFVNNVGYYSQNLYALFCQLKTKEDQQNVVRAVLEIEVDLEKKDF